MHPKQKTKLNDLYVKIDLPMWIAADFECMNVPLECRSEKNVRQANCLQSLPDDFMDNILVNKSAAIVCKKCQKSLLR